MKTKDPFIAQTAHDYDMNYEDVENIKKKYPNSFYEKLEDFIKHRSGEGNPKMMTEFEFHTLYFRKQSRPSQLRKVRKKDLGLQKVVKVTKGDGWTEYLCENDIEVRILDDGEICCTKQWLILSSDDIKLEGNKIIYKNPEEFIFTI